MRLSISLTLGAVTTWIVAWGCEVAVWAEWSDLIPGDNVADFATRDETLFVKQTLASRAHTSDTWEITRLDRPGPWSKDALNFVEFFGTPGEIASAGSFNGPVKPGWIVPPDPPIERPSVAAEFDRTVLGSRARTRTRTTFHLAVDGWPARSMLRMREMPEDGPAGSDHWMLTIDALQRPSSWSGKPRILKLPLRPLWPGFLLDTGFYAVLWALPLFGLPLIRQSRRKRKGRCPKCAYDLKRDFNSGCPECGWRRAGNARAS